MNKFSTLLLGSSALTFISLNAASALTISETTDFGNTFATRTFIDITGSGSGDASASGPLSSGAESSGVDASGPAASGSVFGGATIFGNLNSTALSASASGDDAFDYFTLTGLTPGQSVNIDISPAPDASGTISSNPRSFAITLLNSAGGVLNFEGDSIQADSSASGSVSSDSGSSSDSGPAFSTIFGPNFSFDAEALTNGELNFRIESGASYLQDYSVVVSDPGSAPAASVDEPSSMAGLAIGAAGLGFIAARRRRRK